MNLALYRRLLARPDWQKSGDSLQSNIAEWVLCQKSLTEKLSGCCETFSVEVIQQGWQEKTSSKNTALSKEWLREVVLRGDGLPWIFAQTTLPNETIQNVAQYVLQLDDEPIGLWLFNQPMKRVSLTWQQDLHLSLIHI